MRVFVHILTCFNKEYNPSVNVSELGDNTNTELFASLYSFCEQNPVAWGQAWGRPVNLSIHFDGCSRCRAPSKQLPHTESHARYKNKTVEKRRLDTAGTTHQPQHIDQISCTHTHTHTYHHIAIIWSQECQYQCCYLRQCKATRGRFSWDTAFSPQEGEFKPDTAHVAPGVLAPKFASTSGLNLAKIIMFNNL